MQLLTPGIGLIFWQAVVFLALVFILAKFAWKPILQSLKIRDESIQKALDAAEKAKSEMAQLKSDNEKLMQEARQERDQLLKAARETANSIKDEAKADASKESAKIIEDARMAIQAEKNAALADVRNQVAALSLDITEKLLRKQLSGDSEQKALIEDLVKDINVN